MSMNRRDFLKNAGTIVAVTAVAGVVGDVHGAEKKVVKFPDLVAVRNGEPVAMFRKAIEELGGMKSFVKPGQKVVVKPNIGWDKTPELAANTNPDLVGEIVAQCIACGAKEVIVFDHTCNDWKNCYKNSGIEEAVEKAGGKIVNGNDEKNYIEKTCEKAVSMKTAKIHEAVVQADVFINVPVLKNHGGAVMTCAMKNFMGLVWDRRWMHNNNLQQTIADSVLYRVPDLNIVDAYRIMHKNGPQGRSADDVKLIRQLLISRDIVAIDTASSKILEQESNKKVEASKVSHIELGEKLGLGIMDLKKITIKRLDLKA